MPYLSCLLPCNARKNFLFICFAISIFFATTAKAQYDVKYAIAIGTDYDAPVGNFSYTFKPATNCNLSFTGNSGNITGSVNFGYHNYKTKQDTFYYQVSDTEYGRVHYQNFPVYSFYLGWVYNLELTEKLKVYGGINLGLYYTHFVFQARDFIGGSNTDLHEEDVYFAPRLGFSYPLTENVGIGIESKYNFFCAQW